MRHLRHDACLLAAPRGAHQYLAHDGRHEQRHAVTAIVHGTHERFVSRERGRALCYVVCDLGLRERIERNLLAQVVQAQLAPHGRFREFAGAGHLPSLEQPDEFDAALAQFLADV